MLFSTLIDTTSEIIKIAFKSPQPTDIILSKLLREKKYIGSKERQFVSETTYCILRNLNLLKYLSNNIFKNIYSNNDFAEYNFTFELISLLLISKNNSVNLNYFPELLIQRIYPNKSLEIEDLISDYLTSKNYYDTSNINLWLETSLKFINDVRNQYNSSEISNDLNVLEQLFSLPEWISKDLEKQKIDPLSFACAVNVPAQVCLRITQSEYVQTVENMLKHKDIPYHFSSTLPLCIILDKRAKIDDSEEYSNGLFEIQDEGSQLISYALAPQGRCTVLDACAGAGGKTLHISDICPDAKEIIASDNDFLRLKALDKRLRRYNKKNITSIHIKDMDYIKLKSDFKNSLFDYILVDAPCSGLGTMRRDPLKKFRTNDKIVNKMHEKQVDILSLYSKFLKKDGIIIYATCSVHSYENLEVVEEFLMNNPEFTPEPLAGRFRRNDIFIKDLDDSTYYLNLYPHIHGTDGFFMAALKKIM